MFTLVRRRAHALEAAKKFAEDTKSGALDPTAKDFNQGAGPDAPKPETSKTEVEGVNQEFLKHTMYRFFVCQFLVLSYLQIVIIVAICAPVQFCVICRIIC